MSDSNNIILKMEDISKTFGAVHALDKVKFELKKGEIHALLGENGAGKSTFLNIMSGSYKQDKGEICLNGEKVTFKNPLMAKSKGIIKVHQELQLIPAITVAQNMFLGNELLTSGGLIDFKQMESKADEMLTKLNAEFKSSAITGTLSTAQQQMVEIAKALLYDFNVLALDEPTASLTTKEIKKLFSIITQLRKQGKSIIYISHRIEEVFEICDRATVFRDGKYVDVVNVADVNRQKLVKMMVGRDISNENFHTNKSQSKNVVLEVKEFSDGIHYKDVNLKIHKGEIVGLAGLVGAGRTELVRGIFGADKRRTGEIFVTGEPVNITCPSDAIRHGIMLIPEDRKLQGFVPGFTNTYNIALPNLKKYIKRGILDYSYMKKHIGEITQMLDVHPNDNGLATKQLSGGNQQKIVVAKALNVNPDILILDEPTRGIDIKAKQEIYVLIRKLADEGKAIIMISSELSEVLKMSDRILIMYEGHITGEIDGKVATENEVMHYAVGG
ncbi:sugar ABC transporter ATP-binding protein [Muricomes intestini]|uniref:sugar ABC transporter ATP-binding protein n=1 Tax=Muricomes intestini TaxID=1796634 RepID=UPI002FE2A7DB